MRFVSARRDSDLMDGAPKAIAGMRVVMACVGLSAVQPRPHEDQPQIVAKLVGVPIARELFEMMFKKWTCSADSVGWLERSETHPTIYHAPANPHYGGLRGARVDEALDALGRYLDDASLAGLEQVLIIHGLGTGALRDAVRAQAATHPLVKSFRAGERGEGGDGATIVRL